ncbi:MAG: undecaprenyldiphospho-muramoylpentapeptide beta-N-acetylglucosaminyltransferase [Eubacteriales bacterium]|nr:undecaprenyldiphospho-muramoylpentapeptide beta-N-acetylglucosaminyltransferase [Eubacteriales bacterium]
MKRIILTGGGTAGHVTPNLALIPKLQEHGYEILYIGSYNGIEKELIEKAGIAYRGIASGKLRRYFDLKNFTDPFRVLRGYAQAKRIIKEFKPDVIFSKGGFVAVPVTMAAKNSHVPVIAHESDMTPGLANKLSMPSCTKICCNFPETVRLLPKEKAVLSGSPIRAEILKGSREAGLSYAGFSGSRPVILVIGGSLGSVRVNEAVRSALPRLLETFDLIHICGKGNLDERLKGTDGYVQYEYVSEPLKDLFAAADLMISRAGANAICEILALRKPNLLIPLGTSASRGDQILNARSFERQGFSEVLEEEKLSDDALCAAVEKLWKNRETYISAMERSPQSNGVDTIISLIDEITDKKEKQGAE